MNPRTLACALGYALVAGSHGVAASPDQDMCALVPPAHVATPVVAMGSSRGAACSGCQVEVFFVLDSAFVSAFGLGATQRALDIIEAANDLMSPPQSEGGLDLELVVTNGIQFPTTQPWTHSNNAGVLLNNFFSQFTSTALPLPADGRDAIVLFSGASLNVAGIAFQSSVCQSNAVCVVDASSLGTSLMGRLLAHQFGHMLGAVHDGVQNTCPSTGFIMSESVSGTTYSDCSIDEVNAYLSTHSFCLAAPPCNAADLAEPFGSLDFSDVVAFLGAFAAMDGAADLAPPIGVFDFSDVVAFLAAFGAGCP